MKLQNIIFPNPRISNEENLYYRILGIPFLTQNEGDRIQFCKNHRINFDTYFNSFSLFKWYKYTNINDVKLKLILKGKFVVNLIHFYLKPGGKLEWKIIEKKKIESLDSPREFCFNYITDVPFGLLSFGLESLEDDGMFLGGYYYSDIEEKNIHNVKIGIGICTYKREKYIQDNINHLKYSILENETSALNDKIEIFISDNAGTLEENNIASPKIHIFKNKNTGGSGGFTRTMIEVNKANKNGSNFSHILLMDDDIIFDSESIYRTFAILSILKDEYIDSFVGGAMFFIDRKYIQHANGEYWHGDRYDSFITTYNLNRDMRELINVVENENVTNANYQAWWYCVIPMSICRTNNLPLPFFIKSDDIEYSIRNLNNLITINGIAVWHESFESKYSASNEYYTVRNYLITSSIHRIGLKSKDIKKYAKNYILHYLSNFKYLEIELFCKAINDFLKGVDYFKNIDLETYHKKIMENGYKMEDINKLSMPFSEKLYYDSINTPYPQSKVKRFFRILSLNGLLLPSKKIVALGMWGGSNIQTFRAKYIIRYEPLTKKGFILRRSLKKFIKSIIIYLKTIIKIEIKFIKVSNEFADRANEMTNLDFWKSKL